MTKSAKVPRSQGTRDRIVASAGKLFSRLGFDRTTIRAVAADAKIHPSLVIRYFGSKEGLFAASMSFDLCLPDLSLFPARKRGALLARHFLTRWEGSDSQSELPALLRIAVTHPAGKQKLFQIFAQQLFPSIVKIVPTEHAATAAALIATQAIGLAFTRYVIEVPAVVDLTEDQVIASVGGTFQRYLGKP